MKQIKQKHETDCGIACVAMIAGTSYLKVMENAQSTLRWKKSQKTFYTDTSDIKKLLLSFDICSKKGRFVRKWSTISETAICAINYDKKTNNWHWVVYRRESGVSFVLDPMSKRIVRKDFIRMRLRSYIPIELPKL